MAKKKVKEAINKFSEDKIRMELVDWDFIEGIAMASTNGTSKYDPYSWRKVDPERYVGAFMRHMKAHRDGMLTGVTHQLFDDKSGILHIDHAACCLMFLRYFAMLDSEVQEQYEENYQAKTFLEGRQQKGL